MKGDFSRLRFKVEKHYAAVLEQQGRVNLDSDGNEAVAIAQHLRQTTNRDVIGACGVPKHGGGFAIGLTSAPSGNVTDLTVGKGRIYVDGILCELEADTSFLTQKDFPNATWVTPVDGRTDLVYLDVWQRHITAVEDPNLRESALGGPDTTTRLQTVCQVKILQDVGDVSCSEAMPKWDALTAASPARLSTKVEVAPADEPCLVAPGAGYRGLENHLYRVEIHDSENSSGSGSPATYKWSRDNGSIVVAVESMIAGDQLKVARLGWDEVLALRKNDWVEVLDDATELKGIPGTLAKITDIDTEDRVIFLSQSVSGLDMTGHPRVRRWDQASPAVQLSPGSKPLEDGIEVEFTGSGFKTGDYWVFAARVGNGSDPGTIIDPLTAAPPMGIRHHYCKLALITWEEQSAGVFIAKKLTDCRTEFPPLTELPSAGGGCCTVTVGDGVNSVGDYTEIQEAVNAVGTNGRVCVLPGEYPLKDTVVLEVDGLVLSGCGMRARIIGPKGEPALAAVKGQGIQLEDLAIQAASAKGAVWVQDCQAVQIHGCTVVNRAPIVKATAPVGLAKALGPAIVVSTSEGVELTGNQLLGAPALTAQGEDLKITENRLRGGGLWLREGTLAALVADNDIAEGFGAGIALGSLAPGEKLSPRTAGVTAVRVQGNSIVGMMGSGVSTVAFKAAGQPALGDVEDLTVRGNRIVGCALADPDPFYDDEAVGGIVLRNTAGVHIHGNHIASNGANRDSPSCGVFVHTCQGLGITDNEILDNGSAQAGKGKTYQAGIVAHFVLEGGGSLPGKLGAAAQVGAAVTGMPAARIQDNVVVCPKGQALIVGALGPVSVIGNSLTSLDVQPQPRLPQADYGSAVFIWNLGTAPGMPTAGFATGLSATVHTNTVSGLKAGALVAGAVKHQPVPDGRVLFHGNQVTLYVPAATKPTLGAAQAIQIFAAVTVFSSDDVAIQENQFEFQVPGGQAYGVTTMAHSVRLSDNRIAELPGRVLLSYMGLAGWHIATGNQATHCLVAGGTNVIEDENHIMIPSALCGLLKGIFQKAVVQQSLSLRR